MITSDATAPLRAYSLAKQQVAECIRAAQQALQVSGRTEAAERCQTLLVDLAEDRFNLAVVGQFKRGKSSLMNAIIGREVLPTGLLPLTSAITSLCYGPHEKLILRREGWSLSQEVPVEELAEYVTEDGNPGNVKGVLEARLELPVDFLRRGLHFVDTPGIGSFRHENTATTYAFLPQADAVIFVTSVEAPLSDAEAAFLRDIRQYVGKIFFVANKIDLLPAAERSMVLDYIQGRLDQLMGNGHIRLYPVTAQEALRAHQHNSESPQESGLPELQDALAAFLAEEKERVFLSAVLDRLLRLLAEVSDPESLKTELDELRGRAVALRDALRAGQEAPPASLAPALPAVEGSALPDADTVAQPFRRQVTFGSTCPICDTLVRATVEYLIDLQSRVGQLPAAREEFGRSGGLCAYHHWQFHALAAPQTVSDAYAALVDSALNRVRTALADLQGHAPRRMVVSDPLLNGCPVCRLLHQVQADQVATLVQNLARPEDRAVYRHAAGVCLPHLQQALELPCPPDVAEYLLGEQQGRLEALSEDLRNYSLKRAALRRGLINRDEDTAWRRALVVVAGERSVHISGGSLPAESAPASEEPDFEICAAHSGQRFV